jgi:phage terminase small subunit
MPFKDEVDRYWSMRQVFVREYVIDRNGTRAAIAAGFSAKSARNKASQLLGEEWVQEQISKKMKRLLEKADITAERVMIELARVAFSDVRGVFDENGALKPIHTLDDDVAATISGIDIETRVEKDSEGGGRVHTHKIKRADKVAALGMLARHFKIVGGEEGEALGRALELADRLEKARARLERMRPK